MSPDVVTPTLNLPDYSSSFLTGTHWLSANYPTFVSIVKTGFGFLVGLSIPMSIFFFIGIIYCVEGLKRIRNREDEMFSLKVEPALETVDNGDRAMAHRWDKAKTLIESTNSNDWKQAIIEADIMLDDLLTRMGYNGESIGDKLKRVATGDMKSLNEAWEAHKVRNQIAHESSFVLDHHTANETIQMYRKVFQEFYYI